MADKVKILLRGLFKEFQHYSGGRIGTNIKYSWRYVPAYNQAKEEFNKMKNSTNKDEIEDCFLKGELYFHYLQSIRRAKELEEKYKGVGERPIEEIAASVGLKLPEKYQDEKNET